VRVSDFSLQKFVSQLSVDQISRNFVYLTRPEVISPPKKFQNLSTDGQENTAFGGKNTNPHAAIPSSADNQCTF